MADFAGIAKLLMAAGLLLLLVGGVLFILSKLPVANFRLPGDIVYRGEKVTVYFPIVTCIVISLVLSVLLNFFFRR